MDVLIQLPFLLRFFDHRRRVGKTLGRFFIRDRMNRRLVSLAVCNAIFQLPFDNSSATAKTASSGVKFLC